MEVIFYFFYFFILSFIRGDGGSGLEEKTERT